MKTIQIKSLVLTNFKGIRKLKIDDFQQETSIFGANATGKTTIVDAFTWLLFGKDSTDRTNFEIKTLDKDNNEIPKIDHEVEAVITVDGEEIKLKRTFREKWVKKRGALEAEFGGNETLYEWNDVPMIARDFSAKISNLVEESVFKMITSPIAFNALKWQDQRQVLIDIAGGVTNEDVAKGNPEFEGLLSKLTNKSLEEYEKQIKSSIRKSKDEIKAIPTRIDEVERGKPEAGNFTQIEKEIEKKQSELSSVDNQISDKLAAQQEVLNRKSAIQKDIHKLETEIEDEKHKLKLQAKQEYQKQTSASSDIQSKINAKNEDLSKAQRTLAQLENVRKNEKGDIELYEQKNDQIRKEWNERNADEFKMDEDACKCPTCERAFDAEDVAAKKKEFFANFQNAKMKDLEELSTKGKRNKEKIENAKEEVSKLDTRIAKGKEIIEDITADLVELNQALDSAQDNSEAKSEDQLYKDLYNKDESFFFKQGEIENLKETLQNVQPVDISELKAKKAEIDQEISSLKSELSKRDQIESDNKRISELQEEESQLAQTIADYERDQFTIEQFNKAKMDALENAINHRFQFVNFKLFETQVNGGEVPTCKALINGVPFSDANTASKINAGLDIINTLCDHYQVSAPIFIDNRESVSQLIDSQSQIINLIVSEADTKLRVESNVEQLETVA
ncbi:AAA family ATPase [uncultured Christiangramia sp.]|uniref:AAA family ATPase n=1 Tax=uncultured Christiangramia sp. TaxID=503836 RepID=UPI00263240F2|nr:AAA family ATPase [uncultured Christiangramia sp.]